MKRIVFASCVLASAFCAALELGTPFTDGAVLQREKPVRVWGKAAPGAAVKVEFAGKSAFATAAADGSWHLELPAMPAIAKPQTLKATEFSGAGKTKVATVKDVLVGEVWFLSGQSNMECPIWGENPRFRDGKGAMAVSMTHLPLVRFVKNERDESTEPKDAIKAVWRKFEPESFDYAKFEHRYSCSAIGFYFAKNLHSALGGVPVGIVDSSWGGTGIDGWIPQCGFEASANERVKKLAASRARGCQMPKNLFNAMVHPYAPMAFRGMAWYQGCADAGRAPELYSAKLHALRDGWAKMFGMPDLPIYVFQLAPFKQSWCDIYRAQETFAGEEPRAALVPLFDSGNYFDIHPNDKETPAERLLAQVLSREYGFKGVAATPAKVANWKIQDGKFHLEFAGCNSLYVYTRDMRPCEAFEIAGADGVWKKAKIDNYVRPSAHFSRSITVSSPEVAEPKALRYCCDKPYIGTLFGDNSLPVAPFMLESPDYEKTTRESTLWPVPADPAPDGWWMKRHNEKLAEIAANVSRRYDIVMVGDSITHFMESKPERGGQAYAAFTNDFKVLNLGYGGDRTENAVWRELDGELDGYKAKWFFVMIGTNNNDWGDAEPEETSYGVRRVVATIREKHPESKIVLCAILPRGKTPQDAANQKNIRTNAFIKNHTNGKNILWLDFGGKYLDANGAVRKDLMADYLHPTAEGYKIFLQAVRQIAE